MLQAPESGLGAGRLPGVLEFGMSALAFCTGTGRPRERRRLYCRARRRREGRVRSRPQAPEESYTAIVPEKLGNSG